MKTTPQEIWKEHQECESFNTSIDLYTTIDENNDFFLDKQWEGVNCPDLDLVVFNIFKRGLNTIISMIVSNDIGIELDTFSKVIDNEPYKDLFSAVEQEIYSIIEAEKIKQKNVKCLKNAAIEGDMCMYFYFDVNEETGQDAKGCIKCEVIDAHNVQFTNPVCRDAQKQPAIILVTRQTVDDMKAEAKKNKRPQDEIDNIRADSDYRLDNDSVNAPALVTGLIKMWKNRETNTVWCTKVTKDVIIKEEWDTGYSLYPVAFGNWEETKDNYHGHALITGLIPNQIFVNKVYAMAAKFIQNMAFPKAIYDENAIAEWTNEIGAIAVNGSNGAELDINKVAKYLEAGNMSSQVLQMIQAVMADTQNSMGANDALLGDVNPDNRGAIIAIQKSSSMPWELQKLAFYQFIEDCVRIMIDIIATDYDTRKAVYMKSDEKNQPQEQVETFDFSQLKKLKLKLKVDVGASAYWSEIDQTITADNLFSKQVIPTPGMYLDSIPSSSVKNMQKLKEYWKQKEEQPQMAQAPQAPNAMDMQDLLKGVQ